MSQSCIVIMNIILYCFICTLYCKALYLRAHIFKYGENESQILHERRKTIIPQKLHLYLQPTFFVTYIVLQNSKNTDSVTKNSDPDLHAAE